MIKSLLTTALLLCSTTCEAVPLKGLLHKDNLPSTGQEWISLSLQNQAQPADFSVYPEKKARKMQQTWNRMLWGTSSQEYAQLFVDGGETWYDDYAQAWRLLGFYIDCSRLSGDEEDGGGNNQQDYMEPCARYLLWAAVSTVCRCEPQRGECETVLSRVLQWLSPNTIGASRISYMGGVSRLLFRCVTGARDGRQCSVCWLHHLSIASYCYSDIF